MCLKKVDLEPVTGRWIPISRRSNVVFVVQLLFTFLCSLPFLICLQVQKGLEHLSHSLLSLLVVWEREVQHSS